ncbi:MAG: 16S rRNA (uracil(1498)-N(3))-methyltransferase [Nitrospirales bacterium]
MPVFFIQATDLVDGMILVRGELFHHLVKSLRTRPTESLIFNDEAETRYYTSVQEITKDVLHAKIERTETDQHPSRPSIILGQAILKGDKMSWVIQKATELGVHTIVPLQTERVIAKIHHTQSMEKRWDRIGLEAAQQSERWTPPTIQPVCPFSQFLTRYGKLPDKLILAERSDGFRISQLPLPTNANSQIVVAVGPEGGWSSEELTAADAARFSFATLGQHILRAETASLATLAILQSRLQEL